MTGYEMFWPLVAHAVLVFILYALLGWRRHTLVKVGRIRISQFRENHAAAEPAESLVVRNCIANQFELPLLFHACCIVLYVTQADNLPAVILAWMFVATRYAHAFVHVTFDLALLNSWNGCNADWGPDIWTANIVGGPELLRTT